MKSDIISLREFARRLGVGEKTIRDGVRLDKISKGVIIENGKPKINYPVALKEAQDIGLGNKSKLIELRLEKPATVKKHTPLKKDATITDEEIDDFISENIGNEMLSYNKAIEKKENYIAKLKELEYNEKEGKLINADVVYTTLIDLANIKRNNLLSIPDRITDDLMSITDRNSFHKMLYDSIADELEKLSDLKDINFSHD